jgi:hypothetical protein
VDANVVRMSGDRQDAFFGGIIYDSQYTVDGQQEYTDAIDLGGGKEKKGKGDAVHFGDQTTDQTNGTQVLAYSPS